MWRMVKRTMLKCQIDDERGLALIMTVFVIALATILVFELGATTRFDQRMSRRFSEGLQAEYMLKSALNLGRLLVEAPKLEGIQEDWLGEPWALVAATQSLPISGFLGTPRLMIVDEDGKIDLNAIAPPPSAGQTPFGSLQPESPTGPGPSGPTPAEQAELFWKSSLSELFQRAGFQREQYDASEARTLGNIGFAANDQVAVLSDFIDRDGDSYRSALFNGEGIESSADKGVFLNRPLKSLTELLLVPGITMERIARIAPYVRVSQNTFSASSARININTAPLEVLIALGFPENQALEMIQQRANLPITNEILTTLVEGDTQLKERTKVTSSEFSIYARVVMPSVTRWMRAVVATQGPVINRRSNIRIIEFY